MAALESSDVNIKDVAKKAGVSIATVSLALNGKGRISEQTRERIKQVVAELGYVSNRQAAAFRTGKNKSLGFVIQSRRDPVSAALWSAQMGQILYEIVAAALKRGYSVIALPSGDETTLKNFGVSGLVLSDSVANDPDMQGAFKLGIPVATNERSDVPQIAVNLNVGYRDMTMAALDLLKSRGAKTIALLAEPKDLISNYQAELAYLDWCKEKKLKPLVARGRYDRSDLEKQVNYLLDQGADAIYSFYEEGPGIKRIVEARGLKLPEDVMLIATSAYSDTENKELGISSIIYHSDQKLQDFTAALIDVIECIQEPGIQLNVSWELNEYKSTKR